MERVEVVAERSRDDELGDCWSVKLQGGSFELNVHIPMQEADRLTLVRASWEKRESVELGVSGGSKVFWCSSEDGGVNILVGHDDETWDFGVSVQASIGEEILAAIEDERRYWAGSRD